MGKNGPGKKDAKKLKDDVLWHTHLLAIGMLMDHLLAAHFSQHKDPKAAADNLLKLIEQVTDRFTFDHVDAAVSDLAAQELRDTIVRHIHRARALASGEQFDPTRYRGRTPGV